MLQITEDTPPDMLAGAMDLTVLLPTDRSVKMSVERSTPMMDLLVQITTNHHLQLSGFTLQPLGMTPTGERSDIVLPYKPNTPIGTLDTQHIKVIPKARTAPVPKNVPPGHQPFESTFRLKVHLPRNQLFVTRVGQNVYLGDIMKKVCEEKNLDSQKYELRHPGNLDEILDPKLTLSDYAITEIYIVAKGTSNRSFSSNDIMVLRKEEEKKQFHSKTGGGVFNLIFRRGKSSTGSLSSENRSISPTHSDDSRSVTPPGVQPEPPPERPKPPQRKRRPAPKPPQPAEKKEGLTICHSRNSSDSSGYHEASTLSDNCNASLPRRPKSTAIEGAPVLNERSQSTSNLSNMSGMSKSTSALAFPNRKKKTAPPPPPVLKSPTPEEPSPVVASQSVVTPLESTTSQPTPLGSFHSLPPTVPETQPKEVEEVVVKVEAKEEIAPAKEADDRAVEEEVVAKEEILVKDDIDAKNEELEAEDWQYQLPSPPKAFRDASPVTFAQESLLDSVVTSPELFEKLKTVKDSQSETVSVVSEEEKPILSKLSLENLEKRKSLVYNRELATSLKMTEDEEKKGDVFATSLTKFEKTYDEVKRSSPKEVAVQTQSTLPNFKITTYDNPKKKVNIFEDDTVRSNTLQKSYVGSSMENISFRKNSTDGEFKKPQFYRPATMKSQYNVYRSESFSKDHTWVPTKPVTRSVSQVALNKYKEGKSVPRLDDDDKSKSNSLFDVSGLQSLGVMRRIQNKLNTPSNSTEELDKKESSYQEPAVITEVQKPQPVRSYRVPSINMGTWSERPKIPVNVKEDPDYKFGIKDNKLNSKLIVNTINNDVKSYNSVEIRNKPFASTNGVSVRVNPNPKPEAISGQNTGNVLIKIGSATTNTLQRKPLGNVNSVTHQRPHSIAFGSDFDISRVPIVRSVELKKPCKDNNTSVTQIYQNNVNNNGIINNNNIESKEPVLPPKPQVEIKPAFRVNNYLQTSGAPVVRGFRNSTDTSKPTWGQPHSFSTLPSKNFSTNKTVPFSQTNLRRTESTKVEGAKNGGIPPPPAVMPVLRPVVKTEIKTVDCGGDTRSQLLQAIRDFGGKKGLRGVKA